MCGLEWGKIIFDLVKALLWPSAFVWAAWYYRDDIKALAVRVTEFGMTKVVLAPVAPQSQTSLTTATSLSDIGNSSQFVSDAVKRIRELVSTEALEAQWELVRQHLPADLKNHPTEALEFFEQALASSTLQLAYERNYRLIYGSQLALLLKMNAPGGIDKEAVSAAFAVAISQHPQVYPNITNMEQWVGFLLSVKLANEAPNGRYELTALGHGFLRYIVDAKLPPERPF